MELFDYLLAKKKSGGGGSSDLDWSAIGYDSAPEYIIKGYDYAVEILENWDSSQTDLTDKFRNNKNLIIMPLVDTSKATNMTSMFYQCGFLKAIPQLDTSNVTSFRYIFDSCNRLEDIPVLNTNKVTTMSSAFTSQYLTDNTLDNILQMCINAISYTGTKKLSSLGLYSTSYPVSRIEALPHYQDFINAGWTIGY